MRSLHLGLVSVVSALGALAVIACSSPAPSGSTQNADQTADPTPSGPAGTSKPPPTTPPPATPPTTPPPAAPDSGTTTQPADAGADAPPVQADCSATASGDACYQCCDTNNPPGYQIADDAWKACICTAPGACAAQCASTLCSPAGAAPNSACDQCLNSKAAQQCDTIADNACKASPACQAADQCGVTSKCDAKP